MQSLKMLNPKVSRILGGMAIGLWLLGLACGGAATATPPPTSALTPGTPVVGARPTPTATPAPTPAPAAKVNPGKLTIMVGDFGPERFDSVFSQVGGTHNYGRIIGGFLISNNEKKEIVPGIASQWGLSADGQTWTFTIRKGVKFHDGSELTPQDVLWTFQHYFGPKAFEYGSSPRGAIISRAMDKIDLSGPDNVSLSTKQPFTDFAFWVSEAGDKWFVIMPKRAKVHDTAEEEAYDRKPIGAGPMGLVSRVQASVMKFERFDDFYYQPQNGFSEDKRVNFKSLDMYLVPEEATRVAALRAGDADLVPVSLASKKQVEAGGGRLVFGQEGVYMQVKLRGCWEPQYPCHDKRVRQALDYAINKELIRDRLYGGPDVMQVKGWEVITPSTIGYTPALNPFPFDPVKARQLLADAGYPGGKGFGKLIVNTWPSTSMPFQPEAAQVAADNWRQELGLDVEVKVGDSTGISERDRAGELKGQILWRDNETRVDATTGIASSWGDPKGTSRVHEDPELLRLVQETLQLLDADERAEAYKKLFPRLRDESYVLGIGYVNIPWGVGPRVLTWRPYPLSIYPSALHTITLK